ncbi:alpha/beta hydrolase [bacterium]|nr:alpha/beta hydrolase [bacterium]
MKPFLNAVSWAFCILFAIFGVLVWNMGGRLQFAFILGIVLTAMPLFRSFLRKKIRSKIPWWGFASAAVLLWAGVILSIALNPAESIYKSDRDRSRLLEMYDARLAQWPVPYESVFLETRYGRIHVITSGPADAPPVLLIHASGLSAWSWIHNVETLSGPFRTYAVDNIGEGGKNTMKAPGHIPKNGREIADFCSDICDRLEVARISVIGASIGGYIGTQFARHAPERVDRLVLLGPMGYGSTLKTVAAMTLAQGFPYRPVQDATFRWAFGDSPRVTDSFGEWFRVYMKGLVPTPILPKSFTPEQLRTVRAPALAFFGTRDGVVGDARAAAALARNMPDVRIEVVESGHVIGAERPETVNPAILRFLKESVSEDK